MNVVAKDGTIVTYGVAVRRCRMTFLNGHATDVNSPESRFLSHLPSWLRRM